MSKTFRLAISSLAHPGKDPFLLRAFVEAPSWQGLSGFPTLPDPVLESSGFSPFSSEFCWDDSPDLPSGPSSGPEPVPGWHEESQPKSDWPVGPERNPMTGFDPPLGQQALTPFSPLRMGFPYSYPLDLPWTNPVPYPNALLDLTLP